MAPRDESHYGEAEHLVGDKDRDSGLRPADRHMRAALNEEVAQAQVHATLALVDVMRELLSELAAWRQRDSGSQV